MGDGEEAQNDEHALPPHMPRSVEHNRNAFDIPPYLKHEQRAEKIQFLVWKDMAKFPKNRRRGCLLASIVVPVMRRNVIKPPTCQVCLLGYAADCATCGGLRIKTYTLQT